MLRSIPLRLKLVTALVLPMLVVGFYLYADISQSIENRDVAAAQRDEVDAFQSVSALADSIGVEQLLMNSRDATAEQLAAARARTDAAYEALRGAESSISADRLQVIDGHYGTLLSIRESLGDEPTEARLRAASELRNGEGRTGPYSTSLADLSDLPLDVLAAFEFDPAAIDDVATSALVDDYFLIQRARADVRREASTLLRVSTLPGNLVDAEVTEAVTAVIAETDESLEVLAQLASIDVSGDVDSMMVAPAWTRYESFRSAVDAGRVGERVDVDEAAFREAADAVDELLRVQSDDVIVELEETASASVFDANRDVVVSALIGLWLLIGVGILLRFLYRAIKRPLERLTHQASHVARVELPTVIDKMRSGEIDRAPEIEMIPVETKDEVGSLVEAFNDMHRSAVDLAAGQAESRRVVADMFVNLGRRNQRLVGRLLNGLSTLEQHEEDPDKLAALYDLDHTATRMRRNAESLLVLAGAGQARRWDEPVPIHDIARAAIGEVENYQRVSIDVRGEERLDGSTVADVTHLLAELVENALTFSPPNSPVEIVAGQTTAGYCVAVTDHGIGMLPEQIDESNARITGAADEEESPSEFLGHYVVGRLAARHGIRVELAEGPAGGVTARVWLPSHLLVDPSIMVPGEQRSEDRDVTAEIAAPHAAAMPAPVDPLLDMGVAPAEPMVEADHAPTAAAAATAMAAMPTMPAPAPVEPAAPSSVGVADPLNAPLGGTSPVDTALPDGPRTPLAPSSDSTDFLAALEAKGIQPRTSKLPDVVDEHGSTGGDVAATTAEPSPEPRPQPSPAPGGPPAGSAPVGSAPVGSTIDGVHQPVAPPRPAPIAPLTQAQPTAAPAAPTAVAEGAVTPSMLLGERTDAASAAPVVPAAPPIVAESPAAPASAPSAPPQLQQQPEPGPDAASASSPFGTPRRTPGANMPRTALIESIVGSMGSIFDEEEPVAARVDHAEAQRATDGALTAMAAHAAAAAPASSAGHAGPGASMSPPSIDPERVRSALSSFQSGTSRADNEETS